MERPSFAVVMLGDFSARLEIPPSFNKFICNVLPGKATLKDCNGCNWSVKVTMEGSSPAIFYFKAGWRRFVKGHSLCENDVLRFKYDGSVHFSVDILGKPPCERKNGFGRVEAAGEVRLGMTTDRGIENNPKAGRQQFRKDPSQMKVASKRPKRKRKSLSRSTSSDSCQYSEKEDVKKVRTKGRLRISFCNSALSDLLNLSLSKKHWEIIEKIPFCGLKDLCEFRIQPALLRAILCCWISEDSSSRGSFKLAGNLLSLTDDEVSSITGLPNEGRLLDFSKRATGGFKQRYFRDRFVSKSNILEKLKNQLKQDRLSRQQSTDTTRLYVLYIFAAVLFPTTNGRCSPLLCDVIEDLSSLGTYNWAQALNSFLHLQIAKVANFCKNKDQNSGRRKNFSGPAWILQAWFYEQTKCWVGNFHVSGVPSYRKWLGEVKVASGYFGEGTVLKGGRLSPFGRLIDSISDSDLKATHKSDTSDNMVEDAEDDSMNKPNLDILVRLEERLALQDEKIALQGARIQLIDEHVLRVWKANENFEEQN